MPFPRTADRHLAAWFARPNRKPLVLRGARQTGKSTAVRKLGAQAPLFLELNLERHRDLSLVRTCRSAGELLERLQQRDDLARLPPNTLLFLDEVQEHPEALAWLRFFFEDHPGLAVVAAGSLLEVKLRNQALPFPVGRVEFFRLEPLTFLDFLEATGSGRIAAGLRAELHRKDGIPEGLHRLALERFRDFLLVGGLPEAVEVWRTTRSRVEVARVHTALEQAYLEDLLKYGIRTGTRHLEQVLTQAPASFGSRFKIRELARGERDRPVATALDLLERAMVLHRAVPTARTALPLLGRGKAAHKLLPLDVGLALAQLGVNAEYLSGGPLEALMDGRLAEIFAGIQLLARRPDRPRELHFWTREGKGGATAEVDYLLPTPHGVLPIEVKSGPAGSLKSLHLFLAASGGRTGIRLCTRPGGTENLSVTLRGGPRLDYTLITLPLYLAELAGDAFSG